MPEKEYRALLTNRERDILSGAVEVEDSYRYRVVSRVRSKIQRLESDCEHLRRHHEELYAELTEVVCNSD